MKAQPDHDWSPDPQLLAAYFDGELEGCPDLADLRARLETWLEQHPEATGEVKANQRLREAMLDTAAPEPSADAWEQTLARIDEGRRRPAPKPAVGRYWLTACAGAASITLVFGLLFALSRYAGAPEAKIETPIARPKEQPKPSVPEDTEVLPVASAGEIVILRVEGADTSTLVVGLLPLNGPLELADAGDIRVISVQPDARDRMLPHVRQDGPNRPMIWARTDTEE